MNMMDKNSEYCRLNVGEDIGNIVLDDWRGQHRHDTLDQLIGTTGRYLKTPEAKKKIKRVAESQASIRRARAHDENSDLWERYCNRVFYRCDVKNCDKKTMQYARIDFGHHLRLAHRLTKEEIQEKLKTEQGQPDCFQRGPSAP